MPSSSTTKTLQTLTLPGAKIALAAAEAKAKAMNLDMNIAIVDASTHLLAFSRMENAKITSIGIAMDKAFTAAGHRVGTHTYKEAVWPGGPAYGLGNTNGGRFTTFGGGLPILNERGEVVGGIGASTGTPAQDQEVVTAGKEAIERVLREESGNGTIKAKL
ncbi:putative 15.0 kDa protein in dhaT-dhaS intergenic region [Lachnellula hyalina]|uniref:Putative 15.0 kDa protein in dhaT-dhaS intergenic region n=1 Tax=Lachnellula hyalina TaxID=1316788 RepID=A0A8H8R078_9HELO|nr:putative 15.0 kDa protein in dhaT-dhaS intergenic region [Lachnellula hyalina]TVY26028.1 putative 15.0 kDa protein in dhaT-dhaS intergenic region [Lachnellula hyalina]